MNKVYAGIALWDVIYLCKTLQNHQILYNIFPTDKKRSISVWKKVQLLV